MLSRTLGYTPEVGSIVNLIAACVACILTFCIALLLTDSVGAATGAALVLATTPIFAVYGLETSAEPFSSVWIDLVIWFYIRCVIVFETATSGPTSKIFWFTYTSSLLFALSIKRENILLAIVLPLILPLVAKHATLLRKPRCWLLFLTLASSAVSMLFSMTMHLAKTSEGELALLRDFPWTAEHIATFALVFTRSFFVTRWYGGAIVVVLAGTVISFRRRGPHLAIALPFFSYLLLYALHIRSYYEMRSGQTTVEAALRFSMTLMGLWAILGGIGIGAVISAVKATGICRAWPRLGTIMGGVILAALLGASFAVTRALRSEAVEDETDVRIVPASTALDFALDREHSDYIITLEPLIIQMYGEATSRVIDLATVDSGALQALMGPEQTIGFILLDEHMHDTDADAARYGEQTRYLNALPQRTLYSAERFTVVRLGKP